ncbi:MAG: cobalamin-binding protein, partial [Actinomycetota bacterium]|nr:cobalamin-binding protein [Actinomycetota bacterium]
TEVLADVERLADAAQVPEAGRELRAGLETRLAATRERVAGAPRPTVLALEWLDPPFLGGHWVPEMIEMAGGNALLSEAGEKSREVAWGSLQNLKPDVAVVMPCGYYVEESSRQASENANQLAALEAGRIWTVDAASSFSRPGPRLVDGVELLAHLLHPNRADAPSGIGFEPFAIAPGPAPKATTAR